MMRITDHDTTPDASAGDDREPRRATTPEESVSHPDEHVLDPASWDAERLAMAIGQVIMSDMDHPIWSHEPFLRWYANELRERNPRQRRRTDEEFIAFGAAFRLRVEARRLAMRRRNETAPRRRATSVAPPPVAIDLAAAEDAAPLVDLGVAAGAGRELWDEPVSDWVVVPDELPAGRYLALRIAGDSMEPMMHTGDIVLVRLGGPVRVGTVIVARHPDDGYVCKKVRRVLRDRIELESLRAGLPRIVIPRAADHVVGTVVVVWCEHDSPPPLAAA